ncbi:MAG: UDP-N-acetylmuramate--L-alanine ligase [Candidatus Fraserbacteria bacterium RBG_16_55_9]|uniref:UDP-N-acetylmuramate--L-alanine ligase n=1 Tax=Fraserbacteria sp. (strain RBG_16_55_9) TaxID=1817864 RepID=A0A1F5UNL4_FRAXR|nr:MAG: UDP-N-acetylmuramate--L-alanine ligase [Candidatus Fraserbacteria bacterium RBG_16_55_9]
MESVRGSYHFIGIGGDGMSALARVLHEQGHPVSGSDLRETARTEQLRAAGIPVHQGHHRLHLRSPEAVVYSSAIQPSNVELQVAQSSGCKILHRQELLAQLFNAHQSIGIAGTHGKTTTSAMIASLLLESRRDPTFLVGASSPTLGHHARWGRGQWLVAEVDESDGYFTQLHPDTAVVTNVACDHLNHYGSQQALLAGFARFVSQSRKAVLNADDPPAATLRSYAREALTFGIEQPADLVASSIEQHRMSTRADLIFRGDRVGELELAAAPGRHNVANALAALLAGHLLELEFKEMLRIVKEFRLPERRFQILEENGVVVVDDYAHLPEQIEVNLAAVRAGWKPKRVIALFQPHRYSRLRYMNERFARALELADLVVVTDIYPAFEAPIPGVDARSVVEAMSKDRERVHYLSHPKEIHSFLNEQTVPGDFIIGFGAGDIWQILHRWVEKGS